MHDFEYDAPTTLSEALEVLARSRGEARPLAGGTDLIDQVRSGRLTPERLVDVKRIPELNILEAGPAGLRLGAAVPCWRICGDDRIGRDYTALSESCRIIGGVQIQSRASAGGNLCNSGPAADATPSLIALKAICVIAGRSEKAEDSLRESSVDARSKQPARSDRLQAVGRPAEAGHYEEASSRAESDSAGSFAALDSRGEAATLSAREGSRLHYREVPVEQFCTGPGRNVLGPGELLVELRIPPRPPRSGSHYRRFIPRNEMDIAVIGVGASVELDESGRRFAGGRIALGAVAPTPLFAEEASGLLAGRPVSDETIRAAATAARKIVRPIDDMRGTIEFRSHVTGVLVERVLSEAVRRAR